MIITSTLLLCAAVGSTSAGFFTSSPGYKNPNVNPSDPYDYGVDVSYPIHHYLNPTTYQGKRYDDMIKGCYLKYSKMECDATERQRIQMNLDQPKSQHNYTELGFKKTTVPEDTWKVIQEFYEANKDKATNENWPPGNTYTNHWDSPTYFVSLEDTGRLRGAGQALKKKIWDGIRPIIEEWTGQKLVQTSLYGIRIYKQGAILGTHVDRLPLVSSAIIQVAQDVTEPWPIEVYDHSGKAHNVSMKPGDLVLYESHTVLHGRPFPLQGNFYANIFVHFVPVNHDAINAQDKHHISASRNRVSGHEGHNHVDLPSEPKKQPVHRIRDGEAELLKEAEKYPLNTAAALGDYKLVVKLLAQNPDLVHVADGNQWQAIHEAVRSGHIEIVKYLVDQGADLDSTTNAGGSPLWWAKRLLPSGHAVTKYLESIGAPEIGEFSDEETDDDE